MTWDANLIFLPRWLPSYKRAIIDSGAWAVMTAYSR